MAKAVKTRGMFLRGNKWWIRYADSEGKIMRESSGSHLKAEAERLLIRRKQSSLEGKKPGIKKIPEIRLRDFAPEYLMNYAAGQKSYDRTQRFIKQLLNDFGNSMMSQIDTRRIDKWKADRTNIRGNKKSSVNRLLAVLKRMFSVAFDWDMVSQEVYDRVRKVKKLPEDPGRLRYLSNEEYPRLVKSCDNHLKPIVITALLTGMRKSEILGLTWDRVDLENNIIKLDVTKSGRRREIHIVPTLHDELIGLRRRIDTPYVFHNNSGQPFKDVKSSYSSALSRAKIVDFTFHDLRHTFASHFMMENGDIKALQEILGHEDIKMTMRYAHLAHGHKAEAMDKLDIRMNRNESVQKLHNEVILGEANVA